MTGRTARGKRERERLCLTNEKLAAMTFGGRDEWKLIWTISKWRNESERTEEEVISLGGLSLSLDKDRPIILIICEEPAKSLVVEMSSTETNKHDVDLKPQTE